MQDRRRQHWQRILVAVFAAIVVAGSFLAERSDRLYGFVAATLLAGFLLFVIHRRCSVDARTVLLVALLLRGAVFWMGPGLSDDAYRYIWDGRIQHEGINPYEHRPSDVDLAPLHDSYVYDRLNSRDYFSVYPPLSQAVFFCATSIHVPNWRTTYYLIKFIILLIEIGGLFALLRLTGPAFALLYAWNPVVIMEVAGQGHTEGLAAGLLLISLLLARSRRFGIASVAMVGAGMAKLVPLTLLPLLWRRGRWVALGAGATATVLVAAPYAAPGVVSNVLESLSLYVRYFEFNAGPYYAVKGALLAATGLDQSKIIGPAFGWLFAAVLPVVFYLDWRRKWSLEKSTLVVLSAFILLSTTVHPWYVVPLLGVVAVERPVRWHWYWFALLSMGTYLVYVDGPYWLFVVLAWSGWTILWAAYHFDSVLQYVLRRRGAAKFRAIVPMFEATPGSLLDLGAGEGYVGLAASKNIGSVALADIIDMNRTNLPFVAVGDRLPYRAESFDYVLLSFVLHHASQPAAVLREAARVAREGVIVVESVYEHEFQRRVLTIVDKFANRMRSGGLMRAQEDHLNFRTAAEWRKLALQNGLRVLKERRGGNPIHRTGTFLIGK